MVITGVLAVIPPLLASHFDVVASGYSQAQVAAHLLFLAVLLVTMFLPFFSLVRKEKQRTDLELVWAMRLVLFAWPVLILGTTTVIQLELLRSGLTPRFMEASALAVVAAWGCEAFIGFALIAILALDICEQKLTRRYIPDAVVTMELIDLCWHLEADTDRLSDLGHKKHVAEHLEQLAATVEFGMPSRLCRRLAKCPVAKTCLQENGRGDPSP